MFSCSKSEQKQLNTWVSFQSAEEPLLGQFSVSGNMPGSKAAYFDLKMSFIRHRIVKDSEASGLVESMEFVVSQPRGGELEHIHKEVIKFDSAWFESLIRMPVDHPYRRMDRVKMAREELGDLLELTQA